jgi:hypothetical protein
MFIRLNVLLVGCLVVVGCADGSGDGDPCHAAAVHFSTCTGTDFTDLPGCTDERAGDLLAKSCDELGSQLRATFGYWDQECGWFGCGGPSQDGWGWGWSSASDGAGAAGGGDWDPWASFWSWFGPSPAYAGDDECFEGSTECDGRWSVKKCVYSHREGRNVWQHAWDCSGNETCSRGKCGRTASWDNDCRSGSTKCDGRWAYYECTYDHRERRYVWGRSIDCNNGEECSFRFRKCQKSGW